MATETTTTPRLRRLRMGKTEDQIVKSIDTTIDSLLARLNEIHAEQLKLNTADSETRAELFKLLQENNRAFASSKDVAAEIDTPKGRATNVIDVRKYKELVSEDDFFDTIKVGITEAKKILSEKELKPITETTEGKIDDPVLVVKFAVDKKAK